MFSLNQKGVVPPFVLIAGFGLVAFLVLSSTAPFKDKLFAQLFPKPASYAASEPIPGLGLSISPSSVDVTIAPGSTVKVFDLTSTGANGFQFYGYPTSYGPGINWNPQSGGITTGSTIPVSIQVISTVPAGTYQGTGTLRNLTGQQMSMPVTVRVVVPSPAPDTQKPTASITNPLNGTIVKTNSTVLITARAADNVAVAKVEFYVAGSLKCLVLAPNSSGQYSCSWIVPGRIGAVYNLSARATDTSGNHSGQAIKVTAN